jgi:hypothetical protein
MDVHQPARNGTPDFFSRPMPPPARTPEQAAAVRKSNRRTEYLSRHPEYYQSEEHEFAGVLLIQSENGSPYGMLRLLEGRTERR